MKIGVGILGAGFLILGAVKIYSAFFGAPISSSAVSQMEDTIRRDFQARGQQVSQVQLTARDRDRMTGSVTVGNSGVAGSELRYDCTATRQDGSYFRYRCEPASGAPETSPPPSVTSTASPTTPLATAPSGGDAAVPGTMTAAQRAELVAQCSRDDPPALCDCAVDRIAAGSAPGQAMRACAIQLGLPEPG